MPSSPLGQGCHRTGTEARRLLPDLLKHISYAGLTPSLLMPETLLFSPAALPGTLEGSISAPGFPLLTLPSVEVRSRHTAGTCPWIDPFPPSIMNYLSNFIVFILTCVRYHYIPSSSSVHYRTPAFFSCRRFSFP